MTYISAWSPKVGTVVFSDGGGKEWVREGGSRSWRNFNPGNLEKGSFADTCGAIGGDTRFAIFPDEATGLGAVASLFRSQSYRRLTLSDAIQRYAPASENDTAAYVRAVSTATGVASDRVVGSMSDAEIGSLAAAVQTHEGWKAGSEHPYAAPARPQAFSATLDVFTAAEHEFLAPKPQGYVYEQATGRLYLDYGGALDFVAKGYSGAEGGGINNPDAQCEMDIGPLPRGKYLIGAPVTGPSPLSLPLKPVDESVMCGRSRFYIHGDSIAAPGRGSHGCIILARPDRERIVASGLSDLTVVDRVR